MKKFYCVICSKYRKFEKPKISYLLEKTLVFSIICSKCKNEDEKEEESIEILKTLGLINNIEEYQKTWINNLDWKNRWNKKLFNWRNKSKWINE